MSNNRIVSRWHLVTQSDFDKYIGLSGDRNPLHTDLNFARIMLGDKFCTCPIIQGAMINMFLSRDVWQEYGDGAAAGAGKDQRFRVPVMVGDEIGFNYEEIERKPTKIGDPKWDGWVIEVRITPYKRLDDKLLRLGGMLGEILVPTPESLSKIRQMAQLPLSRSVPTVGLPAPQAT